jgi:hypothetical protein
MRRDPEHGGALLAGGAMLVKLQLDSTRSADLVVGRTAALYCAEAGMVTAKQLVAANQPLWDGSLCNPPAPEGTGTCEIGSPASQPAWLAAIDRDLDDDGAPDFVITLVDNHDDFDQTTDSDQQVFVISTCTMFPERSHQIRELVRVPSP